MCREIEQRFKGDLSKFEYETAVKRLNSDLFRTTASALIRVLPIIGTVFKLMEEIVDEVKRLFFNDEN